MTNPIRPQLRKEAKLDLNSALSHAIWSMINRTDIFPFKNCLNCTKFRESEEKCSKYNLRPPARVIAFGCPNHEDVDEIPF